MLACVQLFETTWTVAHQAPLSKGFPRQEDWSRLPYWFKAEASQYTFVVVVRPLSRVRLFAALWTAARQISLSSTISLSLLMSVESAMPSNYLSLCRPLLLPSVFPYFNFGMHADSKGKASPAFLSTEKATGFFVFVFVFPKLWRPHYRSR